MSKKNKNNDKNLASKVLGVVALSGAGAIMFVKAIGHIRRKLRTKELRALPGRLSKEDQKAMARMDDEGGSLLPVSGVTR